VINRINQFFLLSFLNNTFAFKPVGYQIIIMKSFPILFPAKNPNHGIVGKQNGYSFKIR
jgi:hypothetical protein